MKILASTNNVLFIHCLLSILTAWKNTYLKNYSKNFNALILTPYSYSKEATNCT